VKFEDWAEAKPVYAQCAVDALGIPFMFDHDLVIGSSCADCSKPITIEIRNRMIVACNPSETVVWAGTTRSGHAATSVCPTINFFWSSDHVAAWLQGQADATGSMVSLAEAFYIGKEIFAPLFIAGLGSAAHAPEKAQTVRTERAALTATSMGGLVAAFLASICCVGPLVLAALGVGVGATGFLASTAGALKWLLPYRPFFIGLTALVLGVAFYQTYRKPQSACTPRAPCVPASSQRKARVVLWSVAALALALILAPYWLGL
jgi:mercuric ion transport protein